MSRSKKLLLNTIAGVLKQVVTVICGFILPRYMLLFYGSSLNGLISSINNFLGFITLLDMGVGAVIQANLYKPLAEKNMTQISRIVCSSERFFRRLSYIFLVYILFLGIIFPRLLGKEYEPWFTISLLCIISFSSFAQYLFGMTNQLLLNADQRSYVQLLMQTGTIILNTISAIILMRMGMSVHMVKLASAIVYVLRPFAQTVYVNNHYQIDRTIKLVGEPIRQKWNGFSQHFAAVICQNIDIVVLTFFSTLESVSVYSVYFAVVNGVEQIVMTAATGIESMFGNMIAGNEREELVSTFNIVEWIIHSVVVFVFTVTAITIIPFITVYTRDVTDANYIAPVFSLILVVAYAIQCLRVPYFRVIKAAGHFMETQNGAYVSAILNIIITTCLVFRFGLVGAATGTLVAMAYHTCYFVWYLKKNILLRPFQIFVKYMITDSLIAGVSYFLTKDIQFIGDSYIAWFLYAAKISIIVFAIIAVFNCLFYKENVNRIIKKNGMMI